jgi:hypothetical protein
MKPTAFSKFVRPEQSPSGPITDRDLDILDVVLRYRFCSAAQLVHLVGGNEDVTHRRLRRLWERGLINRWAFPGIRSHSEFYYYLDNREPLGLLAERRGWEFDDQMLEEIKGHHQKDYAAAALRGQHMQLGFLQHSLVISRMHFMVEMACRKSAGKVTLESWAQGGQLAGRKAEVPRVRSNRQGGDTFWQQTNEIERLPVEPDALFTLRFPNRPQEQQLAHFFYEADRGTMNSTDMMKKLRAYYHFIKKQQAHRQSFGVHPIRAVLTETTNEARAKNLMALVNHPLVCGPDKRAGLFWFTISTLFVGEPENSGRPQPQLPLPKISPYLSHPEVIFDSIWALPDRTRHALGDAENSPTATTAQFRSG